MKKYRLCPRYRSRGGNLYLSSPAFNAQLLQSFSNPRVIFLRPATRITN